MGREHSRIKEGCNRVRSFLNKLGIAGCLALLLVSSAEVALAAESPLKRYGYRIVNSYPADITAFTQGLAFRDGALYRGTGKRGASRLSKLVLESGEVEQEVELSRLYFGEGIEVVGDRVFQLTWQSNIIFEYDKNTFESVTSHFNPTEGWGLAYDGERLILSDGSATLHFIDPETFAFEARVDVTLNGQAVGNLNELEYIDGEVWANVWQTDFIVRIDPANGEVVAVVDLSGLAERTGRGGAEAVLNGIAYDAEQDRVFVTGKYWSALYEIELIER